MNDTPEISFARNGSASYMILQQQAEPKPFEEEMLMNNDIPSLLTFFSRRPNGRKELWYDITAKKSFRYIVEQEQVDGRRMCAILLAILDAFSLLNEFLISENQIRLNQDTLYLSGNEMDMRVYLCFSPGEDHELSAQLRGLYEYMMPIVDQNDRTMVSVIYEGYQSLADGYFSIDELGKYLRGIMTGSEAPANSDVDNFKNASTTTRYAPDNAFNGKNEPEPDRNPPSAQQIQSEEERRAIFRELFEDDEEPEGVREKVSGFFHELIHGIPVRVKKKKEEIFPPRDLPEDLIYDPQEKLPAPTVLLSQTEESCYGKLVYEGSGNEGDYILDRDVLRIGGRDPRNDILLHSSAVSRFHARIIKRGEDFYVEDLNSSNGTFVNGEAVNVNAPRKLRYMDKVSFADVTFRMV